MLGFRVRQPAPADPEQLRLQRYLWTSDVLIDEFKALYPNEKELNDYLDRHRAPQPRPTPKDATAEDHKAERIALAAYYEAVHKFRKDDKDPGQTALCLSGGGVRSAAFALGVLQALARLRLLSQFDYLSTVSGGGYIGGWLSAWAARAEKEGKSLGQIADELGQIEGREGRRVGDEPRPLVELRKNQDFITPKVGVGSPDTWAAAAIVIRNILLNWVVFAPFIAAVLFLPRAVEWLFVSWATSEATRDTFLLNLGKGLWGLDFRAAFADAHFWSAHYWVDTIGVACVIFALVKSITNRFKPPEESFSQSGFVKWVMTPLVVGAVFLVMQSVYWSADGGAPDEVRLHEWVAFGAGVFSSSFLIATLWWWVMWIRHPERRADRALTPAQVLSKGKWEFIAQFFSGAFIGVLIWSGLWLRHLLPAEHLEKTAKYDAVLGVPWYLMSFLLGQVLLAALTSRLYHVKSSTEASGNELNPMDGDRYREWWARAGGFYGAAALVWVLASWLVIFGWDIFESVRGQVILAATGTGTGLLSLLGASPISPALKDALKGVKLPFARVITLASVVFLTCLAIAIAHGSALLLGAIVHGLNLEPGKPVDLAAALQNFEWSVIAGLALLGFSILASYFVNVNYFSLNAMYRNRLVRAFLGASNADAKDRNKFDGFAASDNLSMSELPHKGDARLFHVVNITLNLTGTANNAWQERKAAPFICTPLHTGGHLVGYRSSELYCDKISLGTAMSLSGAAVSPNWGYHSSTVTSFVLTIFNARLGGWFGNPSQDEAWKKIGPDRSSSRFWQEALGFTTDREPFVYLSDGGHFENLGLYEMVRRRCHVVVLSDAGADPTCTLE
ncbi:MAG TPA: patatin-like phospholipase family protein, partial [Methylocystis sp.]|nr:patatin-like phospholipase family protein [Methylocystis sp.]